MNKTEWEKLSGRQRDALVAEKVMGWKWTRLNRTDKVLYLMPHEWFSGRYNFPADDQTLAEIPKADNGEGGQFWTTKIECAWLVVERMAQKGFDCDTTLECVENGSIGDGAPCSCVFAIARGDATLENWHRGKAKTMPEAICLAALMAIEGLKQ